MTQKFFPTIDTDRLVLRPLDSGDAEALFKIFSDAEVMRYWNTPPCRSLDDARTFTASSVESMERQEAMTLGISLKDTGEIIGKCMLFNYEAESKRAEIGFGIGSQHWGHGFIAEAGKALLDYAFETAGLRRVEAEIDPENTSSAKALERLGFVKEGLLRKRWEIDGVVSDSALYGLLDSDRPAHNNSFKPTPLRGAA